MDAVLRHWLSLGGMLAMEWRRCVAAAHRWIQAHRKIQSLGLLAVAGAVAAWSGFLLTLPDVTDLRAWNPPRSTVLRDRNGKELYFAYEGEDRVWIEGDAIPDVMKKAFIATEDRRFWTRGCIDWRAVARASFANLQDFKSQGASTITQQLVRTALLDREKTVSRKIKEVVLACQLERTMSKEDILEHYLNWISFGGGIAGVQQASRHFFNVDAKDLSLPQAAVLASLPQRPTYFSPYGPHRYSSLKPEVLSATVALTGIEPDDVLIGLTGTHATLQGHDGKILLGGRAHQVIALMHANGDITAGEKADADSEILALQFRPNVRGIEAPHFVFSTLDAVNAMFPDEEDRRAVVDIETTIDLALQQKAQQLVQEHAKRVMKRFKARNVALVIADVRTREILAYVGNSDFFSSSSGAQIDMVRQPRQPGSSIKPIVYATALQHGGWTPATIVYDTPLVMGGIRPRNYGGDFEGPMPVIEALNHSRNIPAIRAFKAVGEDKILDLAASIGAPTPKNVRTTKRENGAVFDYNWPLAIGAAEIPLLEMVQAYGTFANGGMYMPLTGIRSIRDRDGTNMANATGSGIQVIPPQVADTMTSMLSEALARPEGWWRDITNVPNTQEAVKTGTSNVCLDQTPKGCRKMLPRDVWAMGYTPQFIVGVWMGNVDGTPLASNADGLNAAVPLWREMLVTADEHFADATAPRAFAGTAAPYYLYHQRPERPLEEDPNETPTWIGIASTIPLTSP